MNALDLLVDVGLAGAILAALLVTIDWRPPRRERRRGGDIDGTAFHPTISRLP